MQEPTQASSRRAQVSGIGFGVSQGAMYLTYALAFWFGGRQVENGDMTFEDVLKVGPLPHQPVSQPCRSSLFLTTRLLPLPPAPMFVDFSCMCCVSFVQTIRNVYGCCLTNVMQVFFALILMAMGVAQSQMVSAVTVLQWAALPVLYTHLTRPVTRS